MFKCHICNKEFKSNKGGEFTNHLKIHNSTFEEYITFTEYNNIKPRCACGYCNKTPLFFRGKYNKYAKGHNKFSYQITEFIKNNGIPRCKHCNKELDNSKFTRWPIPEFCSLKCSGNNKLEERKVKISKGLKEKWKDDNYRKIITKISKINANKPERKKQQSLYMKELWRNEDFIKMQMQRNASFFQGHRTSKLHFKIREHLELDELGFNLEQNISKYFVDELNKEMKIIIEINDDYVHANPEIYKPDDEIILPGNSYLAKEKWEYDKIRKEYLESLGYKVFIIWESDNLNDKKRELNVLLDLLY